MDSGSTDPTDISRLPLRALGLKPGMAVQTRRLAAGATKREAQYFGGIEGKGVMVGPLGPDGEKTEMEAGEVCVVRGFTGQYEYSFVSKVLQTFEKPFVYALLAYPPQVDARLVRQSLRTACAWPARMAVAQADGSIQTSTGKLVDLSLYGAMVRAESPLAAIGAPLNLTLAVQVEGAAMDLYLNATVCHNNRASYEEAYFIGMVFKGLTTQDKLVLGYLT